MYHHLFFSVLNQCSDSAGWSGKINLKTPPAGGSDEVRFLAYGDMGKAPRDPSAEHYIQVIKLVICHVWWLNLTYYNNSKVTNSFLLLWYKTEL